MKIIVRSLFVLAFLLASALGGFAASTLAVRQAQAAPLTVPNPQVKVTLLDVPNASNQPGEFGVTAVKIADIGQFEVESSNSLIEITHAGRLFVFDLTSSTGAYFELRVDDLNGLEINPGQFSGMGLVRESEATLSVPNTFTGYWQGLSSGSHTVSMWVRSSTGTGISALLDPGSWDSNIVIVKEFLPFGITYLPAIQQ